jgi:dipeptidyl aminopeptidase/acylaminoacyl peptidase
MNSTRNEEIEQENAESAEEKRRTGKRNFSASSAPFCSYALFGKSSATVCIATSQLLVGSLAGIVFLITAASTAVAAEPTAWTPDLMLKVKLIGEPAVSPDGRRVVFAAATPAMDGDRSEWVWQVHLVGADGSNPVQLTRGDKSSTSPAWSPDGNWIAFLSSRGGARNNLWRIRVDGGEAEQITDERSSIAEFAWSPDGSQFAFVMPDPKSEAEERADREKRDAYVVHEIHRRSRLYVVSVTPNADGKRPVRKLATGDIHVGDSVGVLLASRHFDWSPDSKTIAFAHQPTPLVDDWRNSDISLVDVNSTKVTPVTATPAAETQPVFSPDGKLIACAISDDPANWAFAFRVQLVTPAGVVVRMLAESHDQRPMLVGWSQDGKSVLYSETYHTVQRLSALPIDGGKPVDLSPADRMVSTPTTNAARTHIAFVSETTETVPEISVTPSSEFRPRQASQVQEIPRLPTGKTEVITWKSTDGREIEGLLTLPPGYRAGTRIPLLTVVHGGPMGVFQQLSTLGMVRPQYPIAVFASRGYAVFRPNPRGSSGYGKEFRYANYHDWGGGDYRDIMTGVDALIERGVADPERLGIMGWSYGGFMTSSIITQTQRFKAASVGAGTPNLMSFTGTSDIPDFIPNYMGGEYWDQFDRWRARSPLFHIKGAATPTLIQHGDKDLRVPISQGYELYNALRRQGTTVKMVVYPRQAHSLHEPKLQLDAAQRNVEWFDQWLGAETKR